jgi:SAM-dependent methyltransferase
MAEYWSGSSVSEKSMQNEHVLLWRRIIEIVPEPDLSAMTVLDFGCSQGGFLRELHGRRPFLRGIGLDIADGSIRDADAMKGDLPLEFHICRDLTRLWSNTFDLAFSHEVIWLLNDLDGHVAQMKGVLKPGGVYYAATGCHEGNPLWPFWKGKIASSQAIPNLPSYSLRSYAAAFRRAGLTVSLRALRVDAFLPLPADDEWFPGPEDRLEHFYSHYYLFRCVKPM